MEFSHKPVLLTEAIDALEIKLGGIYVDGTAGGGGHSAEIAARLSAGGRLICIDQDPDAIFCFAGAAWLFTAGDHCAGKFCPSRYGAEPVGYL